jgi:ABC-type branched-subunit amino acid transport system substrate-binding protein
MASRAIALILLGAGILSGCGRIERRIRLVTFTELTGPQSPYGEGMRKAASLALEDRREVLENAGWRVELTAYDANPTAQDVSDLLARIAAQADIACALVHTGTAGNFSASTIFHAAGIPAVFPAETAPWPAEFSPDGTIWLSPDDRAHGLADAEWTAASQYEDVVLLADSSDRSLVIGESYQRRAEALGVHVTGFQIPPGPASSAWIPSFNSLAPQLVYFVGSPALLPRLLADLEESGFQGALFYAENEAENRIPKEFSTGVIQRIFSPATADSEDFLRRKAFADKYRTAYGADPPSLSEMGYDAAALCLQPLLGGDAADPNQSSPRARILSAWQSGGVWEGVGGAYPPNGERACRVEIFLSSDELGNVWIPSPSPTPPEGEYPGC